MSVNSNGDGTVDWKDLVATVVPPPPPPAALDDFLGTLAPTPPPPASTPPPSGGPYAQRTGNDHVPLDTFGDAADAAGGAADTSAQTNVDGANDVASNAAAEAAEIGAVPAPQSPAGQAAILDIIASEPERRHHRGFGGH
jgi:hypothetical protein